MIPLRDENPTIHTSVVTFVIIGLNIAAWVLVQGLGFGRAFAHSVCEWGLIPGEVLGTASPGTAVPLGGGWVCMVDAQGNWLTVITSMFMHGGWFHLIGNMWFLAVFGDNVEDTLGPVRFVVFYLLCGIVAAAAQVLSNPSSPVPMIGASGAVGGVMGAYAVLFPRAPVHLLVFLGFFVTRVVVPAYLMLGYWFVLQLLGAMPTLGGAGGGVAFWAHVGGFLAGVVLIKVMCSRRRADECRLRRGRAERAFSLVSRRRPDRW